MDWYEISGRAVLEKMHSSDGGLTSKQAEKILAEKGANRLEEGTGKKAWQIFLEQFQDLLVVVLLAAAVISMISDNVESAVVIFAVIILNALMGTVQHERAQKSLDSLKALSSPAARVMRDGRLEKLSSHQVVPGDVVLLEAGELAVADGRVLESFGLQMDESSLTGESGYVEKQEKPLKAGERIPLAEQSNMIFSGSLVTAGRGSMVVTATGMDTEIGRIARLINAAKEKKTPLQISLDQFGGRLAAVIFLICLLVFGVSLYRRMPLLDSLMFAVALAVAAIPEALGSIVTIVQAMGTQRMAREHAIIKNLKAVESLGCVSVICSDKTGTLTQNRMTVQQVYVDDREIPPRELNPENLAHRYLIYAAVLDNDAVEEIGDPTELALLDMCSRAGVSAEPIRHQYPRSGEVPFDSGRKRMSTIHQIDGQKVLLSKGAPDVILQQSPEIFTAGGIRSMTPGCRQNIRQICADWSRSGLRVIAMACRFLENEETNTGALAGEAGLEESCCFLGMTAIMDPPRLESRSAVAAALRAGIRPVMITGDHPITAMAIGKQIGLYEPGDCWMTGSQLDDMSEGELDQSLARTTVFARVSPEHKIRIVEAWQRRGCIVAMTGDGVNDAPALKKADIGVAMGIAGTEVSKDAADMILTDDNFATIIKAVANGRNVYRNIRHAIQFLLSGNMAGIFCVLYTSLLGLPMPFAPVHLLFINLLTDSLPALAIGMEPQESGLLNQPPRNPQEGILNRDFLFCIVAQGALIAVCTMAAFHTGLETGGAGTASTMAFATLTLARLFHGFNCRSRHSIARLGLSGNLWSVMAFETGVLLLMAVLFLPGLQVLFAVADLSLRQLLTIVIFAAVPTLIIQAWKTTKEALE